MKFSQLLTESQSEYKKNLAKWNADAKKEFENQSKTVEKWAKTLIKMLGVDFTYKSLGYFTRYDLDRFIAIELNFKKQHILTIRFNMQPDEVEVTADVEKYATFNPELKSFNTEIKERDLAKCLSSTLDHFNKIRKKLLITVMNKIELDNDKLVSEIERATKRRCDVETYFKGDPLHVNITYHDEKYGTDVRPFSMSLKLHMDIDYRRGQRVLVWSGGSDKKSEYSLNLSVPKNSSSNIDDATRFIVKWIKSEARDIDKAIEKWNKVKEKSWGR